MKPICVPCQRFYRPQKNGVFFIEGMPTENADAGTAEPEKWQPYKLWSGDRWACEGCGAVIIVGAGLNPVRERHHVDFKEMIKRLDATFQVNDC